MTDDNQAKVDERTQSFIDRMLDMYTEHQISMLAKSFYYLDRPVRKRRLQAIMNLSVERQRIIDTYGRPIMPGRPRGLFSSAFMEAGIEYLIQGDETEVRAYADMYLFEGEDDDLKSRWVPIYAKFREMLLAAVAEESEIQ